IDQLPQVVNFELPNVPEDYVHRIGRTGRAGSPGSALSLVDRSEEKLLSAIERVIKRPIDRIQIDDWDPATMVRAVTPASGERDAERRDSRNGNRGGGRNGSQSRGAGRGRSGGSQGSTPARSSAPRS